MIYFIQQGPHGPIKIGHTTNAIRRLRNLQIGNPDPLHIVATTHGDPSLESKLHIRFQSLRIMGEWFKPGTELLEYIKGLASMFKPERITGEGKVKTCRMCGLEYIPGAADNKIHAARHDAFRDASLPFPFVELLKDWGKYIANHGKLGSYMGSVYDKEIGRRLCAFASWIDSNARLENPASFEQFMAERLDEFDGIRPDEEKET